MGLKALLASLDGLDEAIAKLYTKSADGKSFVLDVEPAEGYALENVNGLKTALSTERTNVRNLTTQLKTYEGIENPAEALKALAKVAEMKDWKLDDKVKEAVEAQKTELIKQHKIVTDRLEGDIKVLTGELENNLITSVASQALSAEKGSVELLLPHVQKHTRMRKTDAGKFVAEVIDAAGNVRIGDSSGNPMSIPQLVTEMKGSQSFARAFEGTGASGSGAGGGGASQGNPPSGGGGAVKQVSRSDQKAMNDNWQGIADGTVKVVE